MFMFVLAANASVVTASNGLATQVSKTVIHLRDALARVDVPFVSRRYPCFM
jgi:hypothetical protein